MPRLFGFLRCGLIGVVLAAALPVSAAPVARVPLLVHPAAADFDGDGRLDVAGAVATQPNVVKLTLTRLGVYRLTDVDAIAAVAALDYDHDGDTDLVVSTAQGLSVWVNDGAGGFSLLPCSRVRAPRQSPPNHWGDCSRGSSEIVSTDQLCAQGGRIDAWRLVAAALSEPSPEISSPRSAAASAHPRAPPVSQ